ncbi:MAG: hypothetical protein JRD89_00470 [Deltaproteobacteria bacterium]|nr:hypothetical protein [Deltaproteobacteria bacterium]
MKLAVWQIDATPRPSAVLEDYVKFSVEHGADIIVFPELLGCWLSATPVGLPRWLLKLEAALVRAYAETVDSPILAAFGMSKLGAAKASDVILGKLLRLLGVADWAKCWMARTCESLFLEFFTRLAREYSCWLVPGSTIRVVGKQLRNTTYLISPSGDVVLTADKIKPLAMEQALGIRPGRSSEVYTISEEDRTVSIALALCNDVTPPTPLKVPAGTWLLVPSGGWAPSPSWKWTWDREMVHIKTAQSLECRIARSYFCSGSMFEGLYAAGRASVVGPSDVIALAPYGQVGMLLCTDSECQWRAFEA